MTVLVATFPVIARADLTDDRYTAALNLAAEKKYTEAVPQLEKLLKDFPKHPKAAWGHLALGNGLLAETKPLPASKEFEAALAGMPDTDLKAEALLGLGQARVALHEDAAATKPLTELFEMIGVVPRLGPRTVLTLGEALIRQEKFAEAARVLDRMTSWPNDPSAARALFLQGQAYSRAEDPTSAVESMRALIRKYWRSPEAPQAGLAAGDALLSLRRFDEAEAEYRRVLQNYSDSAAAPHAQLGLGHSALTRGNYSVARDAFKAAALLYTQPAIQNEAMLRVADAYLAERDYAHARESYGVLTTASDPLVAGEAQYGMGIAFVREGKPGSAVDTFRELGDQRRAGAWSQRGRLRLAELRAPGDPSSAVTLARSVLAEKPEPIVRDEASVTLAELLGLAHDFAASETEAADFLKRVSTGPNADRMQAVIARARLERGDPAAAVTRSTALLAKTLDPDLRAEVLTTLGDAQLRQKQSAAGIATLKEVLDQHADAPAAAGAARQLLAYYREAGRTADAKDLQALIDRRYSVAFAAVSRLVEEAERQLAASPAEALRLLRRALDSQPDHAGRLRVRAAMAEASARQNAPAEVSARIAEIERDAPPAGFVAATWVRAARGYVAGKNGDAANEAYRSARAAGPDAESAPEITLALARRLANERKFTDAEPLLREVVEKYGASPQAPQAGYSLAWCYLEDGHQDSARTVFTELASRTPADALTADAAFRLGEWEYAAGHFAEAARWYRIADVPGAASAPAAAYKLGWTLRESHDWSGAVTAFLRAAKSKQKDIVPEARLRAGEAYLKLQQYPEAAEQSVLVADDTSAESDLRNQAAANAAFAYAKLGQADRALELAGPVANPENGWYGALAHLAKAEATAVKKGAKSGAAEFARCAALYSRFPEMAAEAQFRCAECLENTGDAAGAKAAWSRVIELYGESEWATQSRDRLKALAEKPVKTERPQKAKK